MCATTVLPGVPRSVVEAREWAGKVVARCGCDTEVVDTVRQVVVELATNAVRHTDSGRPGGEFRVEVLTGGGTVRVAVTDQGGADTVPAVRRGAPDAPDGRGLALVERLAIRLGTSGDAAGRTVHADLSSHSHAVLGRDDAIGNLLRALSVKGLPAELDEENGTVAVRHGVRTVTLLAGESAWRTSLPGPVVPFGNEWVLSGRVHTHLTGDT